LIWTRFVCAAAIGLSASTVSAQRQICIYDADGDGHPLFGHTVARADYEFYGGQASVARSTTVAFADFDRDGNADAIVTNVRLLPNRELYYLTVLRGRGDGVFDPMPALYPAGLEATAVEAADLNGDGWPDAATANGFGNSISIHLNAGDGTLLPRVEYAAGQQPRSLKIADLDGDSHPDIVCLNCLSNDVSVFINRGDGTFAPEARTFVGDVTPRGNPNLTFAYPGPFLDVGDLDGNGSIDIAVPARSRVKMLLNDGHAGLALSPAVLSVPSQAYAVVIADVDRDGRPDIAASRANGVPRVAVIRNLGGGQFAATVSYDVTNTPWCPTCAGYSPSLSAGDQDGDGYPDLAVGHEFGYGDIVTLRNQRDGTFGPAQILPVYDSPWFARLADLNRDGRADLAVLADSLRGYLHVLLSDTAGTAMNFELFAGQNDGRRCVAAGDLDGDGDPDLVLGTTDGLVRVVRNDGGTLTDLPPIGVGGSSETVCLADINGDGRLDIVVGDTITLGGSGPGKLWVLINQGALAFQLLAATSMDDSIPIALAAGDFNGDGREDVAVCASGVYPGNELTPVDRKALVFLNGGDGSLTLSRSIVFHTAPWPVPTGGVAAADVTGDGRPDIVATSGPVNLPGQMAVLRNLGDGAFADPELYEVPSRARAVRLVDLNRDGATDIAIAHGSGAGTSTPGKYLTLMYNSGNGLFPNRSEYTDPNFNANGFLDAAARANPGQPRLVLAAQQGSLRVMVEGTMPGSFSSATYGTRVVSNALGVALADLDADGRDDIAHIGAAGAAYTVVLRNRSCRIPCYTNCDGSTKPPVLNVADFICFLNAFAAGDPYANCDGSTTIPTLTFNDFICFQQQFAAGCP
jgi:hypothetical protein